MPREFSSITDDGGSAWWRPATAHFLEPDGSRNSVFALEEGPLANRLPANTCEVAAGDCDLCGVDEHPAYACLWRRYRTLIKARARRPHFTDDIYFGIKEGLLEEARGTEILQRLLDRVVASKTTYGNTGSVTEFLHDMERRGS